MINWLTLLTVPIWIGSAIQEVVRGNFRLATISMCFAIANACLATLGSK